MDPTRPQYAREIRSALVDARLLCERLGLMDGKGTWQRQAGGVIVRCPWHADRSPSCSVRIARDGTIACRCHACDASGDALSLVAAVRGLNLRTDFRQVLIEAANLAGLHEIVHELETGRQNRERAPVPPPRASMAPPLDYPPADEVAGLWDGAAPVSEVQAVATWLRSRSIDPDRLEAADVARALWPEQRLPRWASYQRTSWLATGHRLIVRMVDAAGVVRSVRACRVTLGGDTPKRLPPGGHRASDVVMACDLGIAMLAGTHAPTRVVIVEGEPDFLTWCARPVAVARLGIVSGSWSRTMAMRFPKGAEVIVRTDADRAGDKYANEIGLSLRGHCFPRRDQRRGEA